jgi:predicted aspartyl protease
MRPVFGLLCLAGLVLAGCSQPPPASCTLADVGDFPLTFTGSGQPVIKASIDKHTVYFMIDSGADNSILSLSAYNRLNMTGLHEVQGYMTGAGGIVETHDVMERDLVIGGLTVQSVVFIVGGYQAGDLKPGQIVDGLIGADVLHNFDIGYDFPDKRISFYLHENCATAQAPYAGDFAPVAFTKTASDKTILPYQIDGQTMNFILDSGASDTFVEQAALERLGIKPENETANSGELSALGNLTLAERPEQFSNATIGAESYSDIWLRVVNSKTASDEDGLLGDDYLATHRVFLSNSSDIIYLGLTVN